VAFAAAWNRSLVQSRERFVEKVSASARCRWLCGLDRA